MLWIPPISPTPLLLWLQARGNWPKQMDPPGANRPVVEPEKSCQAMIGCCQVCYHHPMIYDHAPTGIW
jgi:hypothetical protein